MTREEAIDVLKHNYPSACFTDLCEAVDIAIKALSVQPERKKGKWLICDEDEYGAVYAWKCSECGEFIDMAKYAYCPNCGCKMED